MNKVEKIEHAYWLVAIIVVTLLLWALVFRWAYPRTVLESLPAEHLRTSLP